MRERAERKGELTSGNHDLGGVEESVRVKFLRVRHGETSGGGRKEEGKRAKAVRGRGGPLGGEVVWRS